MYVPVWALAILAVGWLGFFWMLGRRSAAGRDLTAPPPRAAAQPYPVYSGAPPAGIPPELEPELRQLLAENRKIEAIKRLREATRSGLAEAKNLVDALEARG